MNPMNQGGDQQNGGYFFRPVGRWTYFWQGFLLVAVKYNLDRLIAMLWFHRSWYFWNYIEPRRTGTLDGMVHPEQGFYYILLLTALPFLWIGITLTVRRLRSAGLSPALCLLFFLPVVNLIFFIVLSLLPEKENAPVPSGPCVSNSMGRIGSALGSIAIVGTAGIILVVIGVKVMGNYGWGLFVGIPFAVGLTSVLLYGRGRMPSRIESVFVSVLPLLFIAIGLLALAFEGLVCLVMASPIAFGLALGGGAVGHAILRARHANLPPGTFLLILASLPFFMGMEHRADLQPPLLRITSRVDIAAPPAKVWPNVVAFTSIDEPREWLFQTGIAYPTHAVIDGSGVGAVRHCVFSTGEFVEPIEVWDAPRLLKFSVAAQPEPLEELSPYPHIDTPHLHGYLVSKEGQIRLIPLENGGTRLEGTTWYVNNIWPVGYWQLWSDFIIHRIHLRVLNHIKAVSEKA